MAGNTSTEAVHLTSLDLDISGVIANLNQVKTLIETTAQETQQTWSNSFGKDNQTSNFKNVTANTSEIKATASAFESLILQYKTFATTLSSTKLSSSSITELKNNTKGFKDELIQFYNDIESKGTTVEEQSKKLGEYSSKLKELKGQFQDAKLAANEFGDALTIGQTYEQVQKAIQGIIQLETSYTNLLKKIEGSKIPSNEFGTLPLTVKYTIGEIQQLSSEIQKNGTVTEAQSDRISAWNKQLAEAKLKLAQLELQAKSSNTALDQSKVIKENEERYAQLTKELSNLIEKYSAFQKQLSSSKLTPQALKDIPQTANAARAELDKLSEEILNSGKVSKEQESRIKQLDKTLQQLKVSLNDATTQANNTGEGFKTMGDKAKQSTSAISDFLNKLSDKIKWLAAYQLIILVEQSFSNIISTIKETEDSVVELQRVLNDNTLSNSAISDELYRIADAYGQTFENVQEAALLFAQTGAEWDDVISLTEATMLALNTAELDVTQSTQGLIAVMSQFKIDASDMMDVIDKINVTADSFAVTSEKIVAALQRAGGTASSFGFSLEETIGIITALSEATGRSGENIGTALNSLITFSAKASSLEKFSDYLGVNVTEGYDLLEVWGMLSDKITESGDELAKMFAGDKDFEGLFNEELATAIGLTEEYNAAVMNSEDVYSAVGTYRQNYFIALLNNLKTAADAIENMNNQTGYSIDENEKYMDTLTAQLNQLTIAAKELAVQFGEMGFLDILKFFTQSTTAVLKLVKATGGLTTTIGLLGTAFAAVKKQKIEDALGKAGNAFSSAKNFANSFFVSVKNGNGVLKTFKDMLNVTKLSLGGWVTIAGVAFTAISMLVGAIKSYNEAQKQNRQEAIATGKEAEEQAREITKLYDAYNEAAKAYDNAQSSGNNLADAQERLTDTSTQLLEALGYSTETIEELQKDYDNLTSTIEKATEAQREQLLMQLSERATAASEAYKDIETKNMWYRGTFYGMGASEIFGEEEAAKLADMLTIAPKNADQATKYIETYTAALEKLKSFYNDKGLDYRKQQLFIDVYEANEAIKAVKEEDEYSQKLYDSANEAAGAVDSLSESQKNVADSGVDFTESLANLQAELETLSETYETINSEIDAFQSAYSTLTDAIDEYNETGILSADMLQKLLELDPEYIDLLDIGSNSLSINTAKTQELINANDLYLQQLAALQVQKYYDELMTVAQTNANNDNAVSQYLAANAAATASGELYNYALQVFQGSMSTADFNQKLLEMAQNSGISMGNISALTSAVSALTSSYSGLLGLSGRGTLNRYVPAVSTGGGGGGGGSSANNAERKALQEQIKMWQDKKEEVEEYYDDQIDALKEIQEANDRINDQLDYYASRQEIITNLEQAGARSGIEYRQKEMEYQQELIDLEAEWQDKLADWDIEDQISQLEALKEQSVEQISAIIEELQDKVSNLSSSTASGIASGVSSGLSYASSAVDSYGESLNEMVQEEAELMEEQAVETSTNLLDAYQQNFTTPLYTLMLQTFVEINNILAKAAETNAKTMYSAYDKNFVTPLKQSVAQIMSSAMYSMSSFGGFGTFSSYNSMVSNRNLNFFANVANTSAANSTSKVLSSLMGFNNPRRI